MGTGGGVGAHQRTVARPHGTPDDQPNGGWPRARTPIGRTTEADPATAERGIESFRDESLPRIKGAAGLCSFQLLVDRASGRGMVATAWENAQAADDLWPTAQELRAQATGRADITFSDVETFSLVRTTVQLG